MIVFTDANLQIHQDGAQPESEKTAPRSPLPLDVAAVRSIRKVGKVTVRSWQLFLTDWRDTSITSIVADMESKGTL